MKAKKSEKSDFLQNSSCAKQTGSPENRRAKPEIFGKRSRRRESEQAATNRGLLQSSPRGDVVEVTGLEPTTSWSRTKRATKLRYTSLLTFQICFRSFHDLLVPRRCSRALSHAALSGTARVCARQLLSPKISLAPLPAIFEAPVPCALPNSATPRC